MSMDRRRESRAARRKRVMRNRIIAIAVLILLVILIIVILISCNSKKKSHSEPESQTSQTAASSAREPESTTEKPAASITNDKPVHLYIMDYDTMTCNRVSEFATAWTPAEDLESFGAFCSPEESFPFTTETDAQNETWNRVNTATKYKIGYELSFDVGGQHKIITILEPGDIESNPDLYMGDYPEDGDYDGITGYMGVWVYDDLHQDGGFYTHITQDEVTDETLLTSIKLRPTPQSDEISNLVLKAFSYSSPEEFDSNGHYCGNYASQVTINNE